MSNESQIKVQGNNSIQDQSTVNGKHNVAPRNGISLEIKVISHKKPLKEMKFPPEESVSGQHLHNGAHSNSAFVNKNFVCNKIMHDGANTFCDQVILENDIEKSSKLAVVLNDVLNGCITENSPNDFSTENGLNDPTAEDVLNDSGKIHDSSKENAVNDPSIENILNNSTDNVQNDSNAENILNDHSNIENLLSDSENVINDSNSEAVINESNTETSFYFKTENALNHSERDNVLNKSNTKNIFNEPNTENVLNNSNIKTVQNHSIAENVCNDCNTGNILSDTDAETALNDFNIENIVYHSNTENVFITERVPNDSNTKNTVTDCNTENVFNESNIENIPNINVCEELTKFSKPGILECACEDISDDSQELLDALLEIADLTSGINININNTYNMISFLGGSYNVVNSHEIFNENKSTSISEKSSCVCEEINNHAMINSISDYDTNEESCGHNGLETSFYFKTENALNHSERDNVFNEPNSENVSNNSNTKTVQNHITENVCNDCNTGNILSDTDAETTMNDVYHSNTENVFITERVPNDSNTKNAETDCITENVFNESNIENVPNVNVCEELPKSSKPGILGRAYEDISDDSQKLPNALLEIEKLTSGININNIKNTYNMISFSRGSYNAVNSPEIFNQNKSTSISEKSSCVREEINNRSMINGIFDYDMNEESCGQNGLDQMRAPFYGEECYGQKESLIFIPLGDSHSEEFCNMNKTFASTSMRDIGSNKYKSSQQNEFENVNLLRNFHDQRSKPMERTINSLPSNSRPQNVNLLKFKHEDNLMESESLEDVQLLDILNEPEALDDDAPLFTRSFDASLAKFFNLA